MTIGADFPLREKILAVLIFTVVAPIIWAFSQLQLLAIMMHRRGNDENT